MKLTSTHYLIAAAIAGLLLIAGASYFSQRSNAPQNGSNVQTTATEASSTDALATCISNSGAKFYGAFWCPHCKEQKALFGSSVHLLPYIECSTADGNSQTQVCIDAQIKGYPTWEFKDGSRVSGVQTLAQLAAKTSCPYQGLH